jgi:hypothetical protein
MLLIGEVHCDSGNTTLVRCPIAFSSGRYLLGMTSRFSRPANNVTVLCSVDPFPGERIGIAQPKIAATFRPDVIRL